MKITVTSEDIAKLPIDAVIVNLFEGVKRPGGATGAVDKALGGAIAKLIAQGETTGKNGETTLIHTLGRIKPRRVLVVGLGNQKELTLDTIRSVTGVACRYLRKLGAKRAATIVHGAGAGGISPEEAAQAITEGSILGLYTFQRHMTKNRDEGELEELQIVEMDKGKIPALKRGVSRGKIIADAVILARDMVNEPANFMTPSDIADIAKKVAKENDIDIEVLEKRDMEKLGMGALLGVAQGSDQPPKFIILHYRGDKGNDAQNIGIVGKGVTFDSGGISLKPSDGMAEMKGDMAGGASVIATLKAISQLKPKVNVTGLIPTAENLPSGSAQKPGDVVKALNGKTIEVDNTDAEGRLLLADALSYGRKLGLSAMIDIATLTGAIRVALGTHCTGAFTNNQKMVGQLEKSGEKTGERIWQMPMFEEYKEQNKSDVADIKNVGGRLGGAITAAQFLAEFSEDTPWVHLDIAGTSMTNKEKGYLVKGATGTPVRALVDFILSQAQS